MRRCQLVIACTIFLFVILCSFDTQAKSGKLIKMTKFVVDEIVKHQLKNKPKEKNIWKKEREKIKQETCILFKKLIIEKKIKKDDLDIIDFIIIERLPKNHKFKKKPYNLTNKIGMELIDDHLTILDYEIIKEQIERIFNSRQNNNWIVIFWNVLGKMDNNDEKIKFNLHVNKIIHPT